MRLLRHGETRVFLRSNRFRSLLDYPLFVRYILFTSGIGCRLRQEAVACCALWWDLNFFLVLSLCFVAVQLTNCNQSIIYRFTTPSTQTTQVDWFTTSAGQPTTDVQTTTNVESGFSSLSGSFPCLLEFLSAQTTSENRGRLQFSLSLFVISSIVGQVLMKFATNPWSCKTVARVIVLPITYFCRNGVLQHNSYLACCTIQTLFFFRQLFLRLARTNGRGFNCILWVWFLLPRHTLLSGDYLLSEIAWVLIITLLRPLMWPSYFWGAAWAGGGGGRLLQMDFGCYA